MLLRAFQYADAILVRLADVRPAVLVADAGEGSATSTRNFPVASRRFLPTTYSDVQTFLWDSKAYFTEIFDEPTAYAFVNVTSYGLDGNFWGNYYHPGKKSKMSSMRLPFA
ncbi:hypothetical protein FISHEDRAFT_75496 [Fistulina hepatica ATCC 64428]|uniref:Uncharacterized protein n=1 Tax=Fistulina hepatica ATCC 64428 TaxID=1128425 RepID=A0A0D7A9F7_9AGAR|nr:hypothetical protein FISHEDRAFT_75496 [Fistulina hepatica ATCC 64428]